MKLKLIALAAGTVLLLSSINVGLVKAQTDPFPALAGIELTQQQQAQMTQLRQQTLTQVQSILTPQQQEQLKTVMAQRQNLQSAIAALNLTPQQKDQLRQVLMAARTQASSILTPEQQQQLRRNIRARIQTR